ncbi:MAG: hypothetical protein ACI4AB_03285 [Acetatifactor sp.]
MRDFILAALPLVLCGIAVAIICTRMGRGKTRENEKALEKSMALGMSLGLLFGVALNGIGLWENHALGFALGPLWGMALATLFQGGNGSGKDGAE